MKTLRSESFKNVYNSSPVDMHTSSMARLNEIGNLSVMQSVENSGRLSAMMGIRAAQTNPIEATAISSLKQSENPGNAQMNGIAAAMAAIMANLANRTPTSG